MKEKETRVIKIELNGAKIEDKMICGDRQIIIKANSHDEEFRIAESIHNQLKGNFAYSESDIVLNMSGDRQDGTENEVHLTIYEESNTNINLIIV